VRACAILAAALLSLPAAAADAVDLQGHRGARGLAPENTLAAFKRALEIGVTTLELDVGITRDGVVVISHDTALNPDHTRDASGRFLEQAGPTIRSLTFAELQSYDVGRLKPGSAYAKSLPDQQAVDGARIPRLADLFELVRASGDALVRFDIETKLSPEKPDQTAAPEEFARLVVEEIRKAGMAARATVQSFDWRTLQATQRIAPEIPTVYLSVQRRFDNIGAAQGSSPWTAGLRYADHGSVPKMIKAGGGSAWSCYFGDLDADKVREAQALGLKVLAWTVNDPVEMAKLLRMGVDGLITDRPDLARTLLEERGLRWR